MSNKIKNTIFVLKEKLGDIEINIEDISRKTITEMILVLEAHIDDFRVKGRTIFNLHNLFMIIFLATLSGFNNCSEFSWFCEYKYDLLEKLGLLSNKVIPSHDTFRRVLMFVNPKSLEKAIYEELNIFFTRVEKNFDVQGKYIHMAIDGKELRGTGRNVLTNKPLSNLQTLNVYNVSRGICLFSTLINKKTNEIPLAQNILRFLNIKNVILSLDALHTQTLTAKIISEGGGYYLFNVKDNQKELKAEIESCFNEKERKKRITKIIKENRTFFFIKLTDMHKEDEWSNQNYYVKYINGNNEPLYFLSSIKEREVIATVIINRWKIENDLHRNKDLLLHEDYIRYTNKNVSNNLALFNNLALVFINLTKDALKMETKKFARKMLACDTNLSFKIIKLLGAKNLSNLLKK